MDFCFLIRKFNFYGWIFAFFYSLFPATWESSWLSLLRMSQGHPVAYITLIPFSLGVRSLLHSRAFDFQPKGAPILPRALSAATGRLILCGAACFSPSGCFVASVSWTLSEVQCLGFCCRDGKKPGDFTPSDLEESHIFRSSLSEFCWASVLSSLYCLRNVIIIFLTFHLSFILSFNYSNTYWASLRAWCHSRNWGIECQARCNSCSRGIINNPGTCCSIEYSRMMEIFSIRIAQCSSH